MDINQAIQEQSDRVAAAARTAEAYERLFGADGASGLATRAFRLIGQDLCDILVKLSALANSVPPQGALDDLKARYARGEIGKIPAIKEFRVMTRKGNEIMSLREAKDQVDGWPCPKKVWPLNSYPVQDVRDAYVERHFSETEAISKVMDLTGLTLAEVTNVVKEWYAAVKE